MCESNAYLKVGEHDEQLILEDVVLVVPQKGKVKLQNLLGDKKLVEAEIDHIDLAAHRIVLRPNRS